MKQAVERYRHRFSIDDHRAVGLLQAKGSLLGRQASLLPVDGDRNRSVRKFDDGESIPAAVGLTDQIVVTGTHPALQTHQLTPFPRAGVGAFSQE